MKHAVHSSRKRMGYPKLAAAILAVLILGTAPRILHAQVFIASKPHPEFWIAPLFITANVRSQDLTRDPGPLTLTVSWSVAPPPNREPASIAQDLYLLWPSELVGTAGPEGADASLVRQVEGAGFEVLVHGRLRLDARSRTQMGTGAVGGLRSLGDAPFVTIARPGAQARGVRPASYIRIPWKPELASLEWLAPPELPGGGAVTRPKGGLRGGDGPGPPPCSSPCVR